METMSSLTEIGTNVFGKETTRPATRFVRILVKSHCTSEPFNVVQEKDD